jgi:hypothetical protein
VNYNNNEIFNMGNTFSCVSGKSADDSPKKIKAPKPVPGLPLPPSKPRVVSETEDCITISWDKPTYDGGNAIFGYAVKMGRDGQSGWRKLSADCEVCTYKATDLEPDTFYKFFVQAENDNGLSKPSEISDQIKTLGFKVDILPVLVEVEASAADGSVAKGDENENEDKEEVDTTAEFGASAEKYVLKDEEEEKSRKSSSSSSSSEEGEADLSVDVEVKEEVEMKEEVTMEIKTVTMETRVFTMVTEEKKVEESESKTEEVTVTTVTKSESKESVKSSSSSSSSDEEKKSNKSAEETKNDIAKAASAGVSVEADFSANGSSVGHGTGVLSSFLDSRLYQYSNDSLLDEDNEEDADVKNKNRVNKNMDIQKHDKRYFIEIETVDAGGNLDSDDQHDEHDHCIHTQIPPMEPVDFDCDQSNRLSMISEKSAEDNLSPCSPDAKANDGQHFVFAKKEVTVNGMKSEASVSKIPMLGSKIPNRHQEPVIINPISAEIVPPKSKIPPPPVKTSSTGKTAQDQGSKLPTLGLNFGLKVESEDRVSPREEPKRQTSIPSFSPSVKVESKIAQPSSIPRRGSGPKTSIPLKKDNSGDNVDVAISGNNTASEEVTESKIPTGIPRRKSLEKPETSSKITPPSTRIATGIPRGTSGIRPPGSFGFQARVDTSS